MERHTNWAKVILILLFYSNCVIVQCISYGKKTRWSNLSFAIKPAIRMDASKKYHVTQEK